MTIKKALIVLLAVVLCVAVLAGCQSNNAKAEEAPQSASTPEVENKDSEANTANETATEPAVPDVKPPEGKELIEAVKQLPNEPLKFAFLGYKNNAFFIPIEQGVVAANEYLSNFNCSVEYVVMGDTISAETCINAVETAVVKGYDAIALVPVNDGTFDAMNAAVDAGVSVFSTMGEGSEKMAGLVESKALAFIGQEAYAAGQEAGKKIAELMDGEGKMAIITGYFTAAQHEDRKNGCIDYLAENYPDIEIVNIVEGKDDTKMHYDYVVDFLQKDPDLEIVYCCASGAYGAAEAINDLGMVGKTGVVCYDHLDENIKACREGLIWAALDQKPYECAFNSLVYLYNYVVAGEEPPVDEDGNIFVPPTIMTPDNVNELYPQR